MIPRFREILTAEHPDYSLLLFALAGANYDLKQYEKSLPLLKEAYALNKKIYGPSHNFTFAPASGVAVCLRRLDRIQEAVEFGEEIVQAHVDSPRLGLNSPDTLQEVEGQISLLKQLQSRAPSPQHLTSIERYESLKRVIITNLEESSN